MPWFEPLSEATTLYGHEKTVFDQHSNEMYMQWISVLGPFFKIKAAFFHEDIVSVPFHIHSMLLTQFVPNSQNLQVVVGDNVAVSHILRHCYNYGQFASLSHRHSFLSHASLPQCVEI